MTSSDGVHSPCRMQLRTSAMMRSLDDPKTREFAEWPLACEALEASAAMADTPAICRAYDRIRRPLTMLAGAAGFRSLLSRSLTLAKQQSPGLDEWEVGPDGSLQGVNGQTAESGVVLIAQLIRLMITLIGEPLTLRLLHDVWLDLPDTELNIERNESDERTDQD